MNLRVYLAIENMKVKELGALIDYAPSYISGVMNGKFKPGKKFIKSVEKATNGKVIILDPEPEPVEEVQKTG